MQPLGFSPTHRDHVLIRHSTLPVGLGIVTKNGTFLSWQNRTLSFWDYMTLKQCLIADGISYEMIYYELQRMEFTKATGRAAG